MNEKGLLKFKDTFQFFFLMKYVGKNFNKTIYVNTLITP